MRSDPVLTTIDAHAGGQHLRILTHGLPRLRGNTMRDRLNDLRTNHDHLRRKLLLEPRGHASLTGALLLRPVDPEADYGVIFMTAGGYGTLSGHGLIALTTALIETGTVPADGPEVRIRYETIVGNVQARASVDEGRVLDVRFRNIPSFRMLKDLEIDYRGQTIPVDVAFGGAWYAIVKAEALGLSISTANAEAISDAGVAIRQLVSNAVDIVHPVDEALAGLYGTIIVEPSPEDEYSVRSATVYAGGIIDRSPCGTGTAAQLACLANDGQMGIGDTFFNESIIGSTFSGRIVMSETVGDLPSVIVEIAGRGSLVGMSQLLFDPADPYRDGFVLGHV
ncbi:MAG: proline racemase family protein [Thermomicrobiales bacterium]|jgi:proline racemase